MKVTHTKKVKWKTESKDKVDTKKSRMRIY